MRSHFHPTAAAAAERNPAAVMDHQAVWGVNKLPVDLASASPAGIRWLAIP